jgi:hypothetical protein
MDERAHKYCNDWRTVAARGVAETTGDAASTAFKEKEQGCIVRLFGTNSLKEGEVTYLRYAGHPLPRLPRSIHPFI